MLFWGGVNRHDPSMEKGNGHKLPFLSKKLFQFIPSRKGKNLFIGYTNHTPGQSPCPGIVGQCKTDIVCAHAFVWVGLSMFLVYFEGFIFWLLFIFDFHFFCFHREMFRR